jgi:hypothetical protein
VDVTRSHSARDDDVNYDLPIQPGLKRAVRLSGSRIREARTPHSENRVGNSTPVHTSPERSVFARSLAERFSEEKPPRSRVCSSQLSNAAPHLRSISKLHLVPTDFELRHPIRKTKQTRDASPPSQPPQRSASKPPTVHPDQLRKLPSDHISQPRTSCSPSINPLIHSASLICSLKRARFAPPEMT